MFYFLLVISFNPSNQTINTVFVEQYEGLIECLIAQEDMYGGLRKIPNHEIICLETSDKLSIQLFQ